MAMALHDEALLVVRKEATRAGASLDVRPVGSVLPRERGDQALAIRFDVTAATLVFAR